MTVCLEDVLVCKEIGYNQREVPNFKSVKIGSIILYYSYDTIIGFSTPKHPLCVTENVWGPTTGKHLNMISEKKDRIPREEFLDKLRNITLKIEVN